jgi:hypothetical protein
MAIADVSTLIRGAGLAGAIVIFTILKIIAAAASRSRGSA